MKDISNLNEVTCN